MSSKAARRSSHAFVAVAAAALTAVALTPSTAHAENQAEINAENNHAWAWWKAPSSTGNGGVAETWSNGENLLLEDFKSDGWGTRAQLQKLLPDSSGVMHWVNHSKPCFDDTSTSNTNAGRTVCYYNISEGTSMRVHIWASKKGSTKYHSYSPAIKA